MRGSDMRGSTVLSISQSFASNNLEVSGTVACFRSIVGSGQPRRPDTF